MEKRLGVVSILLESRDSVRTMNTILSDFGELILARQGLPLRHKGIHVISLVVEGTTDEIGALTGKLGRLEKVQVKSVLTRYREDDSDETEDKA
ncbi:TM1266 family iron-only hydrogenase system putative regulator [Marispirochaeta aestuarii]|uniref:CopG family transcriptional regulator n=1 Tax=Marispirochaeta aestuarii TaxID=1963862 RepID=A0A1Y1RUT3_9SPIO|nr:TM1266 family iron-only hydrogenase system putative regulator [Marispirochaeta aestuarii]ORC31179.1 CopG family transcriptional regulator [Marispirochaeta aestuarii]